MGNMPVKYSNHKTSSKKQSPTFIKELCHQFSLEDLKKSTNNFDEALKIGQSLYSIVYKGYLKHNGENEYPVAIERMTLRSGDWMFKKVIELYSQLHHPNLISLIGFCDQKDEKIIVYEYMFNGTLYDHLRSRDMESLSWKKRLEICIGAARGLHYLHTGAKRTIFHCDIKPQTILLDNKMVPKLSQLGISLQEKRSKSKPTLIKLDTNQLHNIIGTTGHGYMAPECVRTNAFTDKCDVYSFGMVLLDVACTDYKHTILDKMKMFMDHQNEFFEEDIIDVGNFFEKFLDAEIMNPSLIRLIAPKCLAVFMDIMKRCLNVEPNERPTMGEVEVELEHALALQEEADCGESNGDYNFFPTTNSMP
nr:nodulation protein [Melilotus officinalis]